MTDVLLDDDNGSIQLEGEQLERVQAAETRRHAEIAAAWDSIPEDKKSIFLYIHAKIMDGKFDGPNPHNHITYLNQTRNLWVRQLGLRVGQEASNG